MTTDTGTGTAREATATAADEGKRVGGVGADEIQNVASEAKDQARNLVNEAIGHASEQTSTQRDRLVGTLQSLSSDLDQMASSSDSSGMASELARQGAERARALSLRLDGRDPSDLLDDVRSFARRRPGMFLLGALAAGVVVGRLVRGAKQDTGTGETYTRRPKHRPHMSRRSTRRPARATTRLARGTPLRAVRERSVTTRRRTRFGQRTRPG